MKWLTDQAVANHPREVMFTWIEFEEPRSHRAMPDSDLRSLPLPCIVPRVARRPSRAVGSPLRLHAQ